jgi:hypothetical protein
MVYIAPPVHLPASAFIVRKFLRYQPPPLRSHAGRDNVVDVTDVAMTPIGAGSTVYINITGDLPLDITAQFNPTIDINAYYGTWCVISILSNLTHNKRASSLPRFREHTASANSSKRYFLCFTPLCAGYRGWRWLIITARCAARRLS